MGHATGDNRAHIAAEQAISSPLLEQTDIAGAVGMIVNITAPLDFMMHELDDAMNVIQDTAPDAQIIFGLVYKDELELGDEVLVTVIATGFDSNEAEHGGDHGTGYGRQPPIAAGAGSQSRVASSRARQRASRGEGSERPRSAARDRRANQEGSGSIEDKNKTTQSGQQKRDTGAPRETDWEIPAFLRVQKRPGNDK